MAAEPPRGEGPDDVLDRCWASFFAVRADVAAGRMPARPFVMLCQQQAADP